MNIVDYNDDEKIGKEIIRLAIKYNFYVEKVWYFVKGFVYPPAMKKFLDEERVFNPDRRAKLKQHIEKDYAEQLGIQFFKNYVRVGMVGDRVVGFSVFGHRANKSYPKMGLEFVLIDDAERGKGYGKQMVENVIEWGNINKKPEIKIQFDLNDKALEAFYSKLGFAYHPEVEPNDYKCSLEGGYMTWYRM